MVYLLNPSGARRKVVRRRRRTSRRSNMRRRTRHRRRRTNVRRRHIRRRTNVRRRTHRRRYRARRRNRLVSIYPARRTRHRARRRNRVRHRRRARRLNPIFSLRRYRRRRNPDGVSSGVTGLRGPLGVLPSLGQTKGIFQTALGFGAARLVANFVHNAVLSRLPIPGGNIAQAFLRILSHGIGWSLASRLGGRAVGGGFSAGAAASFAVGSAQALFGTTGALPLPFVGPLLSDYETVPAMVGPVFPMISDGGTQVEDYEQVADISGIDTMTGERTW